MVVLTELLSPRPTRLWQLVRQCGVNEVVGLLDGGEQDQRMFQSVGGADPRDGAAARERAPWGLEALRANRDSFAEAGLDLVALEDGPPLDLVRLGAPGRDAQIEAFIEQLRAMGRLGIPLLCYNWMVVSSWARTSVDRASRGGALVTAYSTAHASELPPVEVPEGLTADTLWAALAYFLDAVLPVAEEEGVVLAMHPDDPPIQVVRGIPRIMSSTDGFRRLLSLRESPSNAITYCQGNFALMTDDLPASIREFGELGKIAFVHFRDVRGTADDFEEVFHDDGKTDMAACLREYDRLGFAGPMRPDHVPTMAGESNARPGYETLGRLFALGYIRGLQHGTAGG